MSIGPVRDVALFATGGKGPGEGGSGARRLMEHEDIAKRVSLIVTNYADNGPHKLAENSQGGVTPLVVDGFPKRGPDKKFSPEAWAAMEEFYQSLVKQYGIKWVLLSGWMKQIAGLPAHQVINIHPGPLGDYGGEGMYGDHVHEKIWKDYFDGKIVSSAVTMHFVPSGKDDKMDTGPIIVQVPVSLTDCTSQDDIQKRVNALEHKIQWQVTQHIIDGKITWSGIPGEPVQFQEGLTIDIDGKPFILDGKHADLATGTGYGDTVVKLGGNASGNFKLESDEAITDTPAFKEGLLVQTETGAWETIIPVCDQPVRVKEDIDGVGTKVHIYLDMFEALCREYRDGKISEEECIAQSTDICWVPMLHDLIAMNVDDLRDGQMAVAVTNIIDINHLLGERGRLFSQSMGKAMGIATREIGIGNVAGETAILGESRSAQAYKLAAETNARALKELPSPTSEQQQYIDQNVAEHTKRITDIENCIDLNIGGTVQGLIQGEKLVPLEAGHVLVALYEQPDKNGIIGPRSNGITTIRNQMKSLACRDGELNEWASMKFEDFLVHIGPEQAAKLPDELRSECTGLTLGQIATGKTTVFNPFVSRDLLGGLDGEPQVLLSSITNVTGNPKHKIKNGLRGAENMVVDIDMTTAKLPQVIEIIQRLTGMSDEEAMSSWNMGVPYVLACPASEVRKIREKAEKRGITAEAIGTVEAKKEGEPIVQIQGVGVGKTRIVA